jgi:hypothetical protein
MGKKEDKNTFKKHEEDFVFKVNELLTTGMLMVDN